MKIIIIFGNHEYHASSSMVVMAGRGRPVIIDEAKVGEVDDIDEEGGSVIEEARGLGDVEASGGVVLRPLVGRIR